MAHLELQEKTLSRFRDSFRRSEKTQFLPIITSENVYRIWETTSHANALIHLNDNLLGEEDNSTEVDEVNAIVADLFGGDLQSFLSFLETFYEPVGGMFDGEDGEILLRNLKGMRSFD